MKITFVTEKTLNGAWQDNLTALKGCDVAVFGFNGLGLVSYKKELNGETEYFQDVARLSKQLNPVVISGCDTDTYGVFRHSAVIADRGKLLGVSDMAHAIDESEFVPGGNFRVYDTESGKIGIIVGEDLFFPETARVLSLCDADFLIGVTGKTKNGMAEIMARASAFSNGLTVILMHEDGVFVAGSGGEVLFSARKDVSRLELKLTRDYHKISTKRRGFSFDTV